MLNNVSVQGRFTADPELKTTQNGKSVCSFTLANDQNFKENAVNWLDCVAWGKQAEFIAKHFKKGAQAIITGSLQTRNYIDTAKINRKATEIIVHNCYFCEKKETAKPNIEPATKADFEPAEQGFVSNDDNEDLPF